MAGAHLQLCDPANNGHPGINYVGLRSVGGILEQRLNPQNWYHNSLHPNERGHAAMFQVFQNWLEEHPRAAPGQIIRTSVIAPKDGGEPQAKPPLCDLFTDDQSNTVNCRDQGTTWAKGQIADKLLFGKDDNWGPQLGLIVLGAWLVSVALFGSRRPWWAGPRSAVGAIVSGPVLPADTAPVGGTAAGNSSESLQGRVSDAAGNQQERLPYVKSPVRTRAASTRTPTRVAASLVGVVFGVSVWMVAVGGVAAAGDPACAPSSASWGYVPGGNAEATTTLTPKDRAAKPPPIAFGTSREVADDVAAYEFTVTGDQPDLEQLAWKAALVNGNHAFPTDQVSVTFAEALGDLEVTLCLDPKDVEPGTYSGGVTFAAPGVPLTQIPLTVTVKDNGYVLIIVLMLLVSAAAVFFKWWTVKVSNASADNKASPRQFWRWLKSQWVTVLMATAVGAGGVFAHEFFVADTFVPNQRWGLWADTFVAVMSTSLLLNALGLHLTEGKKTQPAAKKAAH